MLLILAGVSINAVFSDEGIIKQAQKVREKWDNAEQSDLEGINSLNEILDSYINGITVATQANAPKLSTGMIPVKFDTSSGEWVICSDTDTDWYSYTDTEKNGQM